MANIATGLRQNGYVDSFCLTLKGIVCWDIASSKNPLLCPLLFQECHLHLDLLTPGPLMQQLSNECRTVVLASGSLSPIPSLCAELNLFPADAPLSPVRSPQPNLTDALPKIQKRLQHQPPPLEADHVVNLEKQVGILELTSHCFITGIQVSLPRHLI